MKKNKNDSEITIQDIADLASVSKSTVSRFLNSGSVSIKTGSKINEIIKKTGFTPNSFARSLKAKKSNLIGTVVPRLDSYSVNQVLKGIDLILSNHNIQPLILNTYQNESRELISIKNLVKQKVSAILFFATHLSKKHFDLFDKIEVPLILIGQEVDRYNCIFSDDEGSGKAIASYAYKTGHRSIAYFGVTEVDNAVGFKRKKGVFDELIKNKIKVDFFETSFSTKDSYNLAKRILKLKRYTFIICATDNIAVGVLKAARELGIEVPKDISISGFGGDDISDEVYPTLTTVEYDYNLIGEKAASLLFEKGSLKKPHKICFSTKIKVKESTREI